MQDLAKKYWWVLALAAVGAGYWYWKRNQTEEIMIPDVEGW